jgi:hypothetical protein
MGKLLGRPEKQEGGMPLTNESIALKIQKGRGGFCSELREHKKTLSAV